MLSRRSSPEDLLHALGQRRLGLRRFCETPKDADVARIASASAAHARSKLA
jgi:hypothetical protein